MIKDYVNLKRQCLTTYYIGSKRVTIGDLNDKQLEIAEGLLKDKANPTELENRQLNAIKYVQDYRAKCAVEKMETAARDRCNTRLASRAETVASHLANVIEKSYK